MVLSLISALLVILAGLAGVDARGGWSFVRQSSNGTIGPLYMPSRNTTSGSSIGGNSTSTRVPGVHTNNTTDDDIVGELGGSGGPDGSSDLENTTQGRFNSADLDDNTYEEGLLDSQPPPDESGGSADDHSDSDPNGDDPPIVKKVVKALVSGNERQKSKLSSGLSTPDLQAGSTIFQPLLKLNSQKIKVRAGSYITTLTTIVNIGTTGQAFEVSLDSGSDVTWVRNRVCSGNGCSGHSFDSQRSSSFHYGGTPWAMINYADGTAVNYTVCNEALNIGGVGLSNITFGLTSSINLPPSVPGTDGILGLSPPSFVNQGRNTDFMSWFMNSFAIKQVSVWHNLGVQEDGNGRSKNGGEITYGGIDSARVSSNPHWLPIQLTNIPASSNYWQVTMDSFSLGKTDLPMPLDAKMVLMDTGTAQLVLGPTLFDAINQKMGGTDDGQGRYTIECARAKTLEPITFVLGGTPYTLTATQQYYSDGKTCVSILGRGYQGEERTILGVAFLRQHYVTFDYDRWAVGISMLSKISIPVPSPGGATTSIPKAIKIVGPAPRGPGAPSARIPSTVTSSTSVSAVPTDNASRSQLPPMSSNRPKPKVNGSSLVKPTMLYVANSIFMALAIGISLI
ncbi:hypothetical protein BSLG_010360 [Batrachochytrium salamandrivorans]|nr:hypothetical protein BASA62_002594 [Batrachochytrium salamandrivorans]KAJ1328628.1 hypothetical protein BSLG_010360 [Batrachochytrium salamandrivorans]